MIVRFLAFLFKPVAAELRRQHGQEVDARLAATLRRMRQQRLAPRIMASVNTVCSAKVRLT